MRLANKPNESLRYDSLGVSVVVGKRKEQTMINFLLVSVSIFGLIYGVYLVTRNSLDIEHNQTNINRSFRNLKRQYEQDTQYLNWTVTIPERGMYGKVVGISANRGRVTLNVDIPVTEPSHKGLIGEMLLFGNDGALVHKHDCLIRMGTDPRIGDTLNVQWMWDIKECLKWEGMDT